MNVRFVQTFQYLSQFNLNVRYKSDKDHIIFDALFKLTNSNNNKFNDKSHAELNVFIFFNTILVEMSDEFFVKISESYLNDFA